jgi:hypothetical protein
MNDLGDVQKSQTGLNASTQIKSKIQNQQADESLDKQQKQDSCIFQMGYPHPQKRHPTQHNGATRCEIAAAEFVLERLHHGAVALIQTRDTIAVVIDLGAVRSQGATRVDSGVVVVAIATAPVSAAQQRV